MNALPAAALLEVPDGRSDVIPAPPLPVASVRNMTGKLTGGAMKDPAAEERRRRAIRRTKVARAVALRGNAHALRHGVYAEVALREDVKDELTLLYARAPWLDPVRDSHLVESTARVIVRLPRLDSILDEEPSQVLTSLHSRLERQLLSSLSELGLTPTAAARLGIAALDATSRARKLTEGTLDAYRAPKHVPATRKESP